MSVTATGFQVGVLASAFTVTLSPQGGGAPINTIAVVTGTAVGRSINFVVPPGAPAGAYTLTASGTGYVSGNSLPFTITGPPSFTLSPNSGAQAATVQVTIVGSNTTFPPGGTTANFGAGISVGGARAGASGPVSVQPNGTAIATLIINPAATVGARTVTVDGTDTLSLPNGFIVTSGPRTLTLINADPNPAAVASPVSVTATGFEVGVCRAALYDYAHASRRRRVDHNWCDGHGHGHRSIHQLHRASRICVRALHTYRGGRRVYQRKLSSVHD